MAEVNLAIHGRTYGIACDDGQENRVSELGRYVDTRLREIASSGAASNDSHLLVLTALVLADEIYDARESIAEVQQQVKNVQPVEQRVSEQEEKVILNAISNLTQRIDSVTDRLESL
jgi:cell division protein ZapA